MNRRVAVVNGLAALAFGVVSPARRDEPINSARLLVPAYFYPSGDGLKSWKTLIDSSARAPIVAIVNPDSGPGKRVDDNYSKLFDQAKGTKITLIGYVTLSYGKRPLSAVKADVDSWLHFYPAVAGIFFDEQPSQLDQVGFAVESFAYARSKIERAVLVTNPGIPCVREYLAARDSPIACMFEHETGFSKYQLPDWASSQRADRFAVLLYNVKPADEMRNALGEAIRKRCGYVYITDAAGPNPWVRLPGYWEAECEAIRAARVFQGK